MLNIVIVNAYGRTNRGDCVLLDECIADINRKFGQQCGELSVALFDPQGFSDIYPDVVPLERIGNAGSGLQAKLRKARIWLVALAYCLLPCPAILRLLPAEQAQTARKILTADVVVSAPGGYIHDTNLAYLVATFHVLLGVRGGARVVLAPQSYGPLTSRFSRWLISHVFNKVAVVCARESYSYDFLQNIGVDKSLIQITGDSAFWNDQVLQDGTRDFFIGLGLKANEEFLGMTVVDWTFPGTADPHELKRRYIAAMRNVIQATYTTHGLRTVIFNQVQDDLSIAAEIANGLGDQVLVDTIDKEPELLRGLIAQSKAFVGTRFHSCIFALMAGVPTNAVAYLPKTQYILHDLGFTERHVNIDAIDSHLLVGRIFADLDNLDVARQQIESAVTDYRQTMTRLIDVL